MSNRFNQTRAEVFAAYTVTALVRDAKARGRFFVRMSRTDMAAAMGGERLRDSHIEVVRANTARYGYGMANFGAEFIFFDSNDTDEISEKPDVDVMIAVTDRFTNLYGSEAADELWDAGGYMPEETSERKILVRRKQQYA